MCVFQQARSYLNFPNSTIIMKWEHPVNIDVNQMDLWWQFDLEVFSTTITHHLVRPCNILSRGLSLWRGAKEHMVMCKFTQIYLCIYVYMLTFSPWKLQWKLGYCPCGQAVINTCEFSWITGIWLFQLSMFQYSRNDLLVQIQQPIKFYDTPGLSRQSLSTKSLWFPNVYHLSKWKGKVAVLWSTELTA